MLAQAYPQPVVAAVGDRLTAAVPEQRPSAAPVAVSAFVPVREQMPHQRRGDRLPPLRTALLPQLDQALVRVEVDRAAVERTATPAGRLGVKPPQNRLQRWVIS